jgi:hypothetical protein
MRVNPVAGRWTSLALQALVQTQDLTAQNLEMYVATHPPVEHVYEHITPQTAQDRMAFLGQTYVYDLSAQQRAADAEVERAKAILANYEQTKQQDDGKNLEEEGKKAGEALLRDKREQDAQDRRGQEVREKKAFEEKDQGEKEFHQQKQAQEDKHASEHEALEKQLQEIDERISKDHEHSSAEEQKRLFEAIEVARQEEREALALKQEQERQAMELAREQQAKLEQARKEEMDRAR